MKMNKDPIISVRLSKSELRILSKELNVLHAYVASERIQEPRRLAAIDRLAYIFDRELSALP